MKSYCFPIALLLAIAVGSRLSLAAGENGRHVPAGELRELAARAGSFLTSAGGWHWHGGAVATGIDGAMVRPLRRSASPAAGRKRLRKASAGCIPAGMCRKRKVLCGKRCYRTRSSLSHVSSSSKCVVKCKKCVPTC